MLRQTIMPCRVMSCHHVMSCPAEDFGGMESWFLHPAKIFRSASSALHGARSILGTVSLDLRYSIKYTYVEPPPPRRRSRPPRRVDVVSSRLRQSVYLGGCRCAFSETQPATRQPRTHPPRLAPHRCTSCSACQPCRGGCWRCAPCSRSGLRALSGSSMRSAAPPPPRTWPGLTISSPCLHPWWPLQPSCATSTASRAA